jgi:hypothetical protein
MNRYRFNNINKDGRMDCKYFDGCSAPLCPRDEGAADRTWFPDEDICRLVAVPEWVKRQRKVSRKAALGCALSGYFTLAMLEHDCRISRGMKGIDPDGTDAKRAAEEAAWFKAHPVITAEEREKLRATAEKLNAESLGFKSKKDPYPRATETLPGKKGIQDTPKRGYLLETRLQGALRGSQRRCKTWMA